MWKAAEASTGAAAYGVGGIAIRANISYALLHDPRLLRQWLPRLPAGWGGEEGGGGGTGSPVIHADSDRHMGLAVLLAVLYSAGSSAAGDANCMMGGRQQRLEAEAVQPEDLPYLLACDHMVEAYRREGQQRGKGHGGPRLHGSQRLPGSVRASQLPALLPDYSREELLRAAVRGVNGAHQTALRDALFSHCTRQLTG